MKQARVKRTQRQEARKEATPAKRSIRRRVKRFAKGAGLVAKGVLHNKTTKRGLEGLPATRKELNRSQKVSRGKTKMLKAISQNPKANSFGRIRNQDKHGRKRDMSKKEHIQSLLARRSIK